MLDLVQSKHDLVQSSREVTVKIDRDRDANLTQFGKAVLDDRYLLPDESYQDLFARVATHYGDEGSQGTLAIFGPSRMEYQKVIPLVNYFGERLSFALERAFNEGWSLEGRSR